MNDRAYLLRYHEIALKGENRKVFEDRLATNARKLIQRRIGKEHKLEIQRLHGRIIIHTEDPSTNPEVESALGRLFGASSFSPVRIVPTTKEAILAAAHEELNAYITERGTPASFRVQTRRSDKVFPEKSFELDQYFGGELKDAHPEIKVDLDHPEVTVGIEVRFNHSYVWTRKVTLHGGLPVGSNGRTLALISGGIDSPVAAIQTLRRGSPVGFVHFYGTPFVGEEALEKVEDLVRIVNRYAPDPQPLTIVPFGKIQEKIALVTNPKLRTVLYRRMMVRIAEKVTQRMGALALVTGESLGQVASQTLENMTVINAVAKMPILRPLVMHDKDEVIALAQKWETFQTSVKPAADCCTLFADRHPATRASMETVEQEESKFSIIELVAEAVSQIEVRWVKG